MLVVCCLFVGCLVVCLFVCCLFFFASIHYAENLNLWASGYPRRANSFASLQQQHQQQQQQQVQSHLEQIWHIVQAPFQNPATMQSVVQPPRTFAFSLTFLSFLSHLPRPCALLQSQAYPRASLLEALSERDQHQLCVSLFDLAVESDQHLALSAAHSGLLAENESGLWTIDSINQLLSPD